MDVRREKLAESRERIRRRISGEKPIDLGRSREEISDIISAMVTGKNSVNIVNLPNEGQIRDLPTGDFIETYGAISGLGPPAWPSASYLRRDGRW
jgi:alpha-galactosidase/6-phospho-beta-glucosidase family protein